MDAKNVILEKKGPTAYVRIARPKVLNALNAETMNELREIFLGLRRDDDVRGVIVTGEGEKAFVAGADISELAVLDPEEARQFALRGQHVFGLVETAGKPVIAAVNGFALGGGCELALACTMRVAAENAVFGQPEVKLGLIPGYGGTQRLARIVGKGIAAELIVTGRNVKADEAFRIGLVNRVVPAAELIPACEAILGDAYKVGPLAVRYSLEAIQRGLGMTLEEGCAYEAVLFGLVNGTEDAKEGCGAFLEKRKAEFKGR
ncbi:MAG: enoyl-CoA hydratase-related protein [Candidatus Eisenbacteria bacterium]